MKFLFILLFIFPTFGFALDVGEHASEFSLPSNINDKITLTEYKGKVVLVDFWASWCASCATSMPWLNELQEKLGNKDFQVLAVNLDEEKNAAENFITKHNISLLIGFDPEGKTPEAYGMKSMPSSFLINREGKIIHIHEGFSPNDALKFQSIIEDAIKEKS